MLIIISSSIGMHHLIVFILFVTLSVGCREMTVRAANDSLVIRTGTSFGMCLGDKCQKDYVFAGSGITLTHRGNSRGTPTAPKTCQNAIAVADWTALKAIVSLDAFSQQPDVIGCPDCADGGAEYIELEQGDSKYRVTFPYGQTIPGFEPLVTALRQQRSQFNSYP